MNDLSNLPTLPPLNEEMKRHFERLLWGPGIGSSVLGRNRKTVQRWFKPDRMVEVETTDLKFVRRIVAFMDAAQGLHYNTPPGDMTAEAFRSCVYAFGWEVRPTEEPRFSNVARIQQRDIRLMAAGRMPVSVGMQRGFAPLMVELDKPPFLAAQAKAQASHEDMQEDQDDEGA